MKSAVPKGQASCVPRENHSCCLQGWERPDQHLAVSYLSPELIRALVETSLAQEGGKKSRSGKELARLLAASPQAVTAGAASDVMEWVCWDTASCSPHAYSALQRTLGTGRLGTEPSKGLRTLTATGRCPTTAILQSYQSKTGLWVAEFESRRPPHELVVFACLAWPLSGPVSVFPSVKQKGCRS